MPKNNYCPSCGSKLDKDYTLCPHCGENLEELESNERTYEKERTTNTYSKPVDYRLNGMETFVWGLVGFFIPLLGLIIYIMWRTEKPEIAGAVGTGALISVVITMLLIMFVATIAGSQMTMMF
ncbi:MAG: zinc ribbon domain-containing protein [Bacillota bacterium]